MMELKEIMAMAFQPTTRWQERECYPDTKKEAEILVGCMMEQEPAYDWQRVPAHGKVLASMIAWVWRTDNNNQLMLNQDKGLWLYGPIGTGKTTLLKGFRKYMANVASRFCLNRDDDHRLCAWYKSASEIANIYAAKGHGGIVDYCSKDVNLIVDELGREPIPANNYGTKLNTLKHIMQMRYDNRRTSVTHVTTNLELGDIADLYGNYVADRCLEMFNFIKIDGESLRSNQQ